MSVFDDVMELGGGALEMIKHHPMVSMANIARHGIQGAYSAVTGDREHAVDHAAEATTGALGMAGHGIGGLLMGAFGLTSKMATDDRELSAERDAVVATLRSARPGWRGDFVSLHDLFEVDA